MRHLGKNLILGLCVIGTLVTVLGLKGKFGGGVEQTLLSQPSENTTGTSPTPAMRAPQPRVLQAKPVTQQDRTFVSPTGSHYHNLAHVPSPSGGIPISPIPTTSLYPNLHAGPVATPEPNPVNTPTESSVTIGGTPDGFDETGAAKTVTEPAATLPRPEFVVTGPKDSFWSISETVYGSGSYYRALFRHNEANVLRPDQLRPGIEVSTPPLEVLRQRYPADFPAESSPAKVNASN